MLNIIDRSPTAKAVVKTKERFIFGHGMTESGDFWKRVVNSRGHRVDQVIRRMVQSYVKFGGFALHFNYNAMFEKVSVTVLPFEQCRLGKPDDENFKNKVVVYDNWNEFDRRKAKDYNTYNPDPEVIARQVELAGGWDKYRGQIWYFGDNGEQEYPLSPFEPCKNEMITEILMGAGKNSNASTSFLASQIFVYPGSFAETSPYPEDKEKRDTGEQTRFEREILNMLSSMQGASKTGAVGLIENNIKDNEGNPVKMDVMKFDIQNFDKIFEHTEKSCENTIIKTSGVPHILIIPTATGFSQELLNNYYQFFNEATTYDRQIIEETCMEIFRGWHYDINPINNYEIKKLTLTIDN
ncbi:MAG: hypothetical protein EA392_00375 [Cryomorphaceae bacterium]|nr:MAG: hypothetical protein EA392_00375 [Cryomorphaceae bacterium]